MNKTFVIEHLEPTVGKWCKIEYANISKIVGKNNLMFTNLKKQTPFLKKLGKTSNKSVSKLNLNNVCILDPEAKEILTPKDAKKFDYFIFGGILGDYPPKKRTKQELTKFMPNVEKRNIGKRQFPTDNAVKVVQEIINGKKFQDLKFKYKLTIRTSKFAEVTLPFNYLLVNNKPFIQDKIVTFLKRKRGL